MAQSRFSKHIIEDPSIARCAEVQYWRLWTEIERRIVEEREPFFVAREKVLAEEMRDIAKAFGKTVADRASLRILQTAEIHLSAATKKAVEDRLKAFMLEHHLKKTGGRLSWLDRVFLRFTGYPW